MAAGDFVKFSWTTAYAATVLAWGFLEYSDAYQAAGEADHFYDCLRWPLDYLMRCHTGKDAFVVQVGGRAVCVVWVLSYLVESTWAVGARAGGEGGVVCWLLTH